MDWLPAIRDHFGSKKELLLRALADARRAAADAPKPNESRSDTTINEKQKMINALELDLANLNKLIKSIPDTMPDSNTVGVWSYVETDKFKLILVPDGMGGGQIGEVRLVSITSPIGMSIMGA